VCSKREIWALQTSLTPLLYVEVTVVIERRAVVCSKREIWALQTSLTPLLYVEVTVVIERRAVVCVRVLMFSRYLRFTIEFGNCCDISLFYILFNTSLPEFYDTNSPSNDHTRHHLNAQAIVTQKFSYV
jgi:hypothetical protein